MFIMIISFFVLNIVFNIIIIFFIVLIIHASSPASGLIDTALLVL